MPGAMRVGGRGPSLVTVHDLPGLHESGRFAVEHLNNAGFSPDGHWLLLLEYTTEKIPQKADGAVGRRIRLLDADTYRVRAMLPTAFPMGWNDPVWKFSPDMKTLAVIYWEGFDKGKDDFESTTTRRRSLGSAGAIAGRTDALRPQLIRWRGPRPSATPRLRGSCPACPCRNLVSVLALDFIL